MSVLQKKKLLVRKHFIFELFNYLEFFVVALASEHCQEIKLLARDFEREIVLLEENRVRLYFSIDVQ